MSKPMIRIHNTQTNEVIDREMTNAEYAVWQADIESQNDEKTKDEAKATAKAALLEKLGITAEEAKLLFA